MGYSKRQNQRWHAKKRFRNRFGIEFNRYKNNVIRDMIENNMFAARIEDSLRSVRYRITFENHDMWIVYDRQRRQVVTCYKPEDPPNPA